MYHILPGLEKLSLDVSIIEHQNSSLAGQMVRGQTRNILPDGGDSSRVLQDLKGCLKELGIEGSKLRNDFCTSVQRILKWIEPPSKIDVFLRDGGGLPDLGIEMASPTSHSRITTMTSSSNTVVNENE